VHSRLFSQLETYFAEPTDSLDEGARACVDELLELLEAGHVRAAEKRDGRWVANTTVKRGILLGFRLGQTKTFAQGGFPARDKDTFLPYPDLRLDERNIRVVPGGTSVRRGAHLGEGVIMMPPSYVNVGAYVGANSMIDSHALVGSCAQIGQRVHVSAAAQIGGVLEPVGLSPVVVEDDVLVGGNCGIYEGVCVGAGAVIAAGAVITASTPVYDLVREQVYRSTEDQVLQIPEGAVVIPGSRPAKGSFASSHGLQMNALIIIKYRDERTDLRTALEDFLR
jgi:2,3,4,5-tetrahydropyridine-2,6-dicarboxylate N-succinyltransferase